MFSGGSQNRAGSHAARGRRARAVLRTAAKQTVGRPGANGCLTGLTHRARVSDQGIALAERRLKAMVATRTKITVALLLAGTLGARAVVAGPADPAEAP